MRYTLLPITGVCKKTAAWPSVFDARGANDEEDRPDRLTGASTHRQGVHQVRTRRPGGEVVLVPCCESAGTCTPAATARRTNSGPTQCSAFAQWQ